MLTQFVAAFDDIVIGRFNKAREEQDKINVRYVYAPKQRVLYDVVNLNKTITLPVVAINVTGISRDQTRVFNKIDGFVYQGGQNEDTFSKKIKAPVPVNISISCSILTRYQTDMDQIISNFVPFCNPYVVISWKVPEKFDLSKDQEIRSEVLWSGDINLDYPIETTGSQKARVTADTTFTIKGWLFKDTEDSQGNIFKIDAEFYNESLLQSYDDNYATLSGNTYTFDTSAGLVNEETNTITISGAPSINSIFYNNNMLLNNLTLQLGSLETNGDVNNVILNGKRFDKLTGLLLSSNNANYFDTLTGVPLSTITEFASGAGGYQNSGKTIQGHTLDYTLVNDNTISFNLSAPSDPERIGTIRFVPYTLSAGYAVSDNTTTTQTYSGNDTFIIIES